MKSVWVFNGLKASFPAAVFSSRELADAWIKENGISGTLTQYPLDISALDWSIQCGLFQPKQPKHSTPEFKQSFTSASQRHHHYTDGMADA